MSRTKQVKAQPTTLLPEWVGLPHAPDPGQWEAVLGPGAPGEGTCVVAGASVRTQQAHRVPCSPPRRAGVRLLCSCSGRRPVLPPEVKARFYRLSAPFTDFLF